ncbi:TD and POZ domain-containing protein 1-like [Hyposmocoma kahamanoa]|uniref:TD and POZ domain-containing protein 1-like n=1 Tax=Hyposmocoma kahamanoa TaxID=1477025 RepID=UPI000E6D63C2|nr:TD and POZ domain-containing protein 1-like [Hyposmocoma kahamanoa]
MEDLKENILDAKNIVYGNPRNPEERVKTYDAKWLRLDKIYHKLYRPNFHDIGGTYISQSVADFWFLYQTEQVASVHLLHLFVTSHQDATFTVAVSSNSALTHDKKNFAAFLPVSLKEFHFDKAKQHCPNYITTFSFSNFEVDFLEHKSLYIAVKFLKKSSKSIPQNIIDNMKYNHDFSSLLTDPIYSDFIIESSEGDKFNVHKVLLIAHSEVFKAMLRDDTAESQNSFVKLVDVSTDELKLAIEFIYTGSIKNIDNCNVGNLLALADQFNICGLRELSQYILSKQLTLENAVETLVIADMYHVDRLKIAALKFIKGNPSILKSNAFKEIRDADLLQELCQCLLNVPV